MITSNHNQQIRALGELMKKSKERRKQKLFVVEGPRMAAEIPEGWLHAVYYSESFGKNPESAGLLERFTQYAAAGDGLAVEEVSDQVYRNLSDTKTPQGILAVVRMPSYELAELLKGQETMLLILDSVQDPGNLGTMFRTGEAAGVTGVVMNRTTVDLFNPKTVRSTMGSIYRVPFYVAENLTELLGQLRRQGVRLYAAHLDGSQSYDECHYQGACGFLIGNEGNGLSREAAAMADALLKIPMEGQVESLNAAVSAALFMYEANRQRRRK